MVRDKNNDQTRHSGQILCSYNMVVDEKMIKYGKTGPRPIKYG